MKLHSDTSESGHACASVSHAGQGMNPNLRSTPGGPEAPALPINGSADQSEDPDRSPEDTDDLTPEIQQAFRIFQSFLSEKHKPTTAPFWRPIGPGSHGPPGMSFRNMHDKFASRQYESITAFVADFRLMLENCYRFHGVDHWISKQAQKLEIILEQKLTLLSRTLREKTTLAVTSRGRFGTEDEKVPVGTSSRRRLVPRNLASITVGGSESIMVQALRLEELQRAKDEKRQRELERKEAGEASVKELEEWESSLLALAEPWPVRSMWELPAIGHFLCLAQTALGLPEIVFYELERCLLMPRCSSFLAKVMTSLLCPPHKRASVLRRPPLPYGKWEAELRRRVQGWYRAVGRAEDQLARAEHLGLCHQFFWTLGEASPLEETAFHLLPFVQRVWLLKGLCDHVYETQKDVQDAVLNQPIHECRESILGYDGQENAYIHFPHFCGADLRIYCQSPCAAMEFPLPPFYVRRSEEEPEGSEVKLETYELKDSEDPDRRWSRDSGSSRGTEEGECEPRFTVGESRYKAVSPALNTHTSAKDTDHMTSCPEPARVWTEPIRPGISRLSREHVQKKRKHVKKSFKKRTASSFQRAAASVRKRERRNRRKLAGNGSDAKVLARRPTGPSFQLICSSLDDLRVLISKTEDQLEELDDGKKRSERRPNKRVAVKELHVTLIRLLNELLPWEPKLVKAFQRNRARLKKECDDFKKQPEYENFIREQTESKDASAETAGEPGDGEGKMDRDVEDESEAAEKVGNQEARCRVDRAVMHPSSESGPFTRSSKRSGAIGDEASLRKTARSDSSASEVNVDVACRERAAVIPRVSALPQPSSSFQGSCKPIQALLAKSVGNKVTLTSHPKPLREGNKTSVTACPPAEPVSTEAPAAAGAEPVVYKTAGGVGLLRKGSASVQGSAQMISDQKSVVILPSNLLTQSAENKADKKTTTYLSNASGFTIPENKVPVQQVAPLKDTCTARTPSAVVTPNLRSSAVPKKPLVNESATPDAKQELRTVCIRDSQSILVTTRGGNTGVVKVQTSESGAALPSSPVFAISPQLQAFLMSKSSTVSAAPQSLPTDAAPVKSSTFVAPSTLSQISNDCTSVKTSIPGKSALLATSKDREAVTSGFQQNTVSTCGVKKRPLPGRGTLDQSAFQKVFLVSPSPNIPSAASNLSTTTGTGTLPGSRVMFISNSIPKEAFASELKVSSTSTPALKVIPKLGTTLSCTSSGTNIGVPGSMSNKSMPSATEASVIVSRASASGGLQMGQKNCLVASRGNAESSPKAPGSVDGKTLTFSTLGSGHMASSALLSFVKPDVTSSVNALRCKPELTTASSTYSGSLISKHTTLPVDATSNKTPINTSFCSSRSLINTTSSVASSPLATPPVVMTPRLRPPTSTTKNIHEKIVINTTAPLAPGTQLLINNTRFVVPPQGLGPGSHVLLINSYPAGLQGSTSAIPAGLQGSASTVPAGLQGSTSAIPAELRGSTSTIPAGLQGSASTVPAGLQGSASTVPAGLQGSASTVPAGLQGSASTVPAGLQGSTYAVPAGLQGSTSAIPAGLRGSTSAVPAGLQGSTSAIPAGLQGSASSGGPNSSTPHSSPSGARGVRLVTPVRLPSPNIGPYDQVQQLSTRSPLNASAPALSQIAQALHPGVSSEIVRLPVFQTSGVSQEASPLRGLPSTTSAVLLQGRPSQTLVVPAVPPMKPAMARHSPMATVPHVSRMQRLPVAMVPPIGAPTNASPATPIASVPPSMNSVVMTPCPPVRAVQPGTVGKPAILPQPIQALNPVLSSTKLLLSPNGAILNIVRASSSGVGVLANTRVVCSSSSSVSVPALSTNDTLGKPETLGRPDH